MQCKRNSCNYHVQEISIKTTYIYERGKLTHLSEYMQFTSPAMYFYDAIRLA